MERKVNGLEVMLSAFAVFFIGWLIFSYSIVPLCVEHGYFVTTAKLMAQGLVPWQDFRMEDTPLGIGLLAVFYKLFGVECSSYLASWVVLAFHLMNVLLLGSVLKKLFGRTVDVLLGVAFYAAILYSTDAFMMNMEPLAVFFMLCGIHFLLREEEGKATLAVAGGMFALAVYCKAQAVVLFPVVFFMLDRTKLRTLVISFVGSCVLLYVGIALVCGNLAWISAIQWANWKFFAVSDIYSILMNFAILAGRCSLFFLILFFCFRKKLDKSEKKLAFMGVGAYLVICFLFIMRGDMAYAMMAYPFVVIAAVALVRKMEKGRMLMILALFVIPTVLAVREFEKLGWGKVKQNQMEELEAVKMVLEDCDNALFIGDECLEFDLGPQIFAEIPHVKPVNLKVSKFGMEKSVDEYGDFNEVVNKVECIIIGQLSYRTVFTKEILSLDEVLGYMENIGTSSLAIFKKTEDTPQL